MDKIDEIKKLLRDGCVIEEAETPWGPVFLVRDKIDGDLIEEMHQVTFLSLQNTGCIIPLERTRNRTTGLMSQYYRMTENMEATVTP